VLKKKLLYTSTEGIRIKKVKKGKKRGGLKVSSANIYSTTVVFFLCLTNTKSLGSGDLVILLLFKKNRLASSFLSLTNPTNRGLEIGLEKKNRLASSFLRLTNSKHRGFVTSKFDIFYTAWTNQTSTHGPEP